MDARMAVMQALMKMMKRPQMPPAQPIYKYGINGMPVQQDQPQPPMTPSVGVRG